MRRLALVGWVMALAAAGPLNGIAQETGRAEAGAGAVWHVAPNGDDAWSGRLAAPNAARDDGPLATPRAALEAARKSGVAPKRVVLQTGVYEINRTLRLDHRDSGLTLEAAPGARPVLRGGRRIAGWRKEGEHLWSAPLPAVADSSSLKAGAWDFRLLVVNGRYCPRARWPEKGRLAHLSEFKVPWMSTTGGGWKRKPTPEELTTLKYKPGDLGEWLEPRNAEITIYHMWDESMVGVKAVDAEQGVLTLSSPCGHPPGAFGVREYVVWNVRKGLTQPGQWMLDRAAGQVVYWPLAGEDMARAEALAPTLESIISIEGSEQQPARGIQLRGFDLTLTGTPLEAGGFGAGKFQGALSVASAEDCAFERLRIYNVGGQGIRTWRMRNSRIQHCEARHTGACGMMARGDDCEFTDNYIHHVGLSYPSAIGVMGGGKNNVYGHNEIHDTPYTAINCGGENTRIEHNLIHRAMLVLHDGGGIYCFAGKNLILRGNFIRDIPDTGRYGSSAYYLDERSQGCLVEGNLSLRVARPTHHHMATSNTLRNNVFIMDGDARLTFPKCAGYTLERNVITAKGQIVFTNPAAITAWRDNVIFSGAGQIDGHQLRDYNKSGEGALASDAGKTFADPRLLEYEKGVVRFAADSPAVKLGIAPLDVSRAGRRK